jgi:membrane protease YdiL (CAAX protease family)
MLSSAPPLTPYHRLARTAARRWWHAPVGTLFIFVGGLVLAVCIFATSDIWVDHPARPDVVPAFGPLLDLAAAFLSVAVFLPVTLAAARWVQCRPAGSLSSVAGKLRLGWFDTCLPVAAIAIVVSLGAGVAFLAATGAATGLDGPLAGWGPFAASAAVLLLVVPVQAAAEEYLTRGWLLQAVGTLCRGPLVPIMVQAVVFAALHGWGTPWGFADLVAVGILTGWLTVVTGGLEAAIALHVMNNLLGGALAVAYGDLSTDQTAADMPWQAVVVDLQVLIAYTAVIMWLAKRRGLDARTEASPNPAVAPHPQLPADGPWSYDGEHGTDAICDRAKTVA